jgi:hypothetical protein
VETPSVGYKGMWRLINPRSEVRDNPGKFISHPPQTIGGVLQSIFWSVRTWPLHAPT